MAFILNNMFLCIINIYYVLICLDNSYSSCEPLLSLEVLLVSGKLPEMVELPLLSGFLYTEKSTAHTRSPVLILSFM